MEDQNVVDLKKPFAVEMDFIQHVINTMTVHVYSPENSPQTIIVNAFIDDVYVSTGVVTQFDDVAEDKRQDLAVERAMQQAELEVPKLYGFLKRAEYFKGELMKGEK